MELTIEQALHRGIEAHKEGNIGAAERLYRAILQSQPAHPDANHNLGVLAVSLNKMELALTSFKTALSANPKELQFWLSYIDALIKGKQFDTAKNVLAEAKKNGLVGEKIESLEAKLIESVLPEPFGAKKTLTLKEKRKKISENKQRKKEEKLKKNNDKSPNQSRLNNFIEKYHTGQHDEAEKLALSMTEQYPNFVEGWQALGAICALIGRKSEALTANQRAVQLAPQNSQAHYNFGTSLQELDRLEEAEAGYNQAIALNTKFTEAHNNLGTTLSKLGRLEEAEKSLRQALALKADFAEAHNNLGHVQRQLNRLKEAEVSCRQAISLKSDYVAAHNNLGITLYELGRLEESATCYRKAILLCPEFAEAILNLAFLLDYMNDFDERILLLEKVLKIDKDYCGLRAAVNLSIIKFLENNLSASKTLLLNSQLIRDISSASFDNEKIYHRFLLNLLNWHEDKPFENRGTKPAKTIYVIGESHSLASHRLAITLSDNNYLCKSLLIMGCKQSDLGKPKKNQYKNKFERIISSLPKCSKVLIAIGEIDCRLNSGIIKHKNKYPEKDIRRIIKSTVENYLNYIIKVNSHSQHDIIIQGIPCPNISTDNTSREEILTLVDVIRLFNAELENRFKGERFGFLDIYKMTDRGDGFSNAIWHIDDYHLSPEAMLKAWSEYPFS